MSFAIYLVGYVVLIAGLALGAHFLNVAPRWIGVGVLCLVGIAIIHGVSVTRHKDPPTA
jgi:predicted signal transduction protein with EAL and GGDEF domain